MADRKAELERKKAKLEELRKEKQRRLKEKEQQEVNNLFFSVLLKHNCTMDLYCLGGKFSQSLERRRRPKCYNG
jgi:hypothetical protein